MSWGNLIKPWVSLAKGTSETLKEFFRPPVTRRYPEEPADLSSRWRGPLRLRGIMDDQPPPVTDATPEEFNGLMQELHATNKVAPCMGGCPANVDARGQNALAAAGRAAEAYDLVRRRNILPGVLGYVCNNPCEDVCRRSYFEEPLAIRQLHRHCYEMYDREVRSADTTGGYLRKRHTRPESVAIIGAGPAGLATSFDLLQMGYRVTIHEREELPGGLLATGIPPYRLDRGVLSTEIQDLRHMGVQMELGVNVGQDITMRELREQHDAVVVAVGYSGGRVLPLPGADAAGVWSALDFLRQYCLGLGCQLGRRIVVVGGGDVGCDCSRSALRCGATHSIQATLEAPEEMPAQKIESEGAREEGVEFMHSWGPDSILTEKGSVAGIRLKKVASRFDQQGNWNPQFTGESRDVSCDAVIFAVGQSLQLGFLQEEDVKMDDHGRPIVDRATGECNVPGLFFAGDIATGPATIIIAMGQAHETALSVHRHIQGRGLRQDRKAPVHPPSYYLKKLYAASPMELMEPSNRRIHMPESDPQERRHSSEQVELGWTEDEARHESIRCMRCQTHYCVACTLCARVCPDNCIDVQAHDTGYERRVSRYDFFMEWCCFCGLCQDICPTQSLTLAPSFDYVSSSRKHFFYDRSQMVRPSPRKDLIQDKDGKP